MRALGRRSLLLMFVLVLGAGAFWATASMADRPQRVELPDQAGTVVACAPEETYGDPGKEVELDGFGKFQPIGQEASLMVAVVGKSFVSKEGRKTVPLQIIANGAKSFAEGIGETRFWVDTSRPMTSAIWEKVPGTEFPAIQEMRFHFFYTVEAMPGRIFRSVNPSIMRSENVRAFPPPPGTVYRLMQTIELEDISNPGVVVGRVLSNRVVIKEPKPLDRYLRWEN